MGQKNPLFLSFSAEGGLDSGQGSSIFSTDSPHLGQLTMSYSCPPPSQPQSPYPTTPSAAQQQQHPGYSQPSQPMVSVYVTRQSDGAVSTENSCVKWALHVVWEWASTMFAVFVKKLRICLIGF